VKTRSIAFALCLSLPACGAEYGASSAANSQWLTPNQGQQNATSGSQAERFFPLVDGMVYTYKTTNEVGEEGLLVARVHRIDGTHGELRYPNGSKQFELRPDGVMVHARTGDAYVLKLPFAEGTSWRGEHGGQSKILKVGVAVNAPAGVYQGCVQTMEERLGDRPLRYSTTFCPDVGVVTVEAATGANYERAELKSYAPPMRMREDGIDKIPASQPEIPGAE
jgi:hypothetical protein